MGLDWIGGAIDVAKKGADIGSKAVTDRAQNDAGKIEIIKAELNSDSKAVKLARPLIIFVGLFIILMEVFGIRIGLLMLYGAGIEVVKNSTTMMEFFMVTWSGLAGTYVLGRSKEKRYAATLVANKMVQIQEQKIEIKHEKKVLQEKRKQTRKTNRQRRRNGGHN